LTAVGVGRDDQGECIFLYANLPREARVKAAPFMNNGWQGYRVAIRKMGVPNLLSGSPPPDTRFLA
jgi:hypothetical protein